MDAIRQIEVENNDQQRNGFQITFALGQTRAGDYGLLAGGQLEPPARVVIVVVINGHPEVLLDGVITNHQVSPGARPGEATLTVTGEDVSAMLDLEEKSETYPNQSDSEIVTQILRRYDKYGLKPEVTTTSYTPTEAEYVETQQATDLAYIQKLARDNGFVFYVEPTSAPGTSVAYWGRPQRLGLPQRALTMHMGPATNVDGSIQFTFNALGPVNPQIKVLDPKSRAVIPIPIPPSVQPPLGRQPALPLRRTIPRTVTNLAAAQAMVRGLAASSSSSDAMTATGALDALRYGGVLRARRLTSVRGAGATNDGLYYVQQVTHRIQRGEYKQSFTLKRDGRGAIAPTVLV
jgi:hypothetical protein